MLKTNEARIETCTYCNYNCKFCPHESSFSRKHEVMSVDLFTSIVNKLKKEAPYITDITISGFGEALLDGSLLTKLMYVSMLDYKVHILTNGSMLDELIVNELLKYEVEDIRISLHSINTETYCNITGAAEHQHKNVLTFIDYISECERATKLILTVDIIDDNRHEVDDIIKEYSDRVDLLEIWNPHNWVDTFNYRNGDSVRSTCNRPFSSPLQIQVDGTINMCCFDYNGKLLLGDFKTQTLQEIFNSNPYLNIRDKHIRGILDDSDYICKNCDQRKDLSKAVIYNNKFTKEDRITRTSTNHKIV